MSFDAHDKQIGKVLNRVVFDIPRNQRRYVWAENNWKELLEDVVISAQKNATPHFIGSIVLESKEAKDGLDYYTIIDGQQRITTIVLALIAIMKLFVELGMDNDYFGTLQYVLVKNNRNEDKAVITSEYHISLETLIESIGNKDNVKTKTIDAFVNTNILSKSRDIALGKALKYFYNGIKRVCDESTDKIEKLRAIRDAIINMTVVSIVSNSEEDSYTIFEILNARGRDLEDHELLKNYIMRYIQPIDNRDKAKTIWEQMESDLGKDFQRFINHYVRHRFGKNQNSRDSSYRVIYQNTKKSDVSGLLNDMKMKSEYYIKFINPKIENGEDNCTKTECEIFSFFRKKRQEQFRPLLLSLIHQKEQGVLSASLYEKTIKFIFNFFVCYTIIGEAHSNKLQDSIYKYAVILEKEYSDDKLIEFENDLKHKIPDFEWFLNSFNNLGWSNHSEMFKGKKNKERVQIVLEVIEKSLSGKFKVPDFTIEHILPDCESDDHAHIGNLIPLEERLNRKCGNKSLNEKSEIYKTSDFAMARNISQRCSNNEFKIADRTKYLCKLVYNEILDLK